MREPGVVTLPFLRICALRMRVSMSPKGSLSAIAPSLPARLYEAGDETLRPKLTQRDARHLHLAIIGARPAGHVATIADAHGRGIARRIGKPDARLEALFHRQLLVVGNHLQLVAAVGVLLDQPHLALVVFNCTLLSHYVLPLVSAFEASASLPEREVELAQERAGFFIGLCGRAHYDVHAEDRLRLVVIDLRKDDVLLDAERVIAAAVKAFRIAAAEIAHARQRDVHQPVEELVHPRLAQRHLGADRHVLAYLEGRDRLASTRDDRPLTGDQREI